MKNANVAIVQTLYARFGNGDLLGLLALLDPDVRWELVGQGKDYPVFGKREGLDGVQAFFKAIAENEQILEFQPLEFHSHRSKVFVTGHARYLLKQSGKTAASEWVHIFTFKGGKVTAFKEFIDTAQIVQAHRA